MRGQYRHAGKKLLDVSEGEITREIFVDDEVYAEELERVFARSWLFVGHESQIPNLGDYFVSKMGDESVILAHSSDGVIRVFLNSCRHRGMKLCRYEKGNARMFSCPFHAWSYKNDGSLFGVPGFRDLYKGQLDKSKWGLIEVAKCANYKGSIWATWDPEAPEFLDYLSGMEVCLDYLLDGWDGEEGGSEVAIGVQKWIMPCNWKFAAENFAGDGYHNISHRSVDLVGIGPSGDKGRRDPAYSEAGTTMEIVSFGFPEQGHAGVNLVFGPGGKHERNYPGEIGEWFREADRLRAERQGDKARVVGGVGNVFPNMSYRASQPRQILMWHPAGPRKTEVWAWYLFDKKAPDTVKQFFRDYALRYCGPGGLTESDDVENWTYATEASNGTIARRYPYNYSLGIFGETEFDKKDLVDIPYSGVIGTTERNARIFYGRWAEYMAAEDWSELQPQDQAKA